MKEQLPASENTSELALVSGATGFIGRVLCTELLSQGYRVRALLRESSDASRIPAGIEVYRSELSDQMGLQSACQGVDLVFHLAGVAHVSTRSIGLLEQTNVAGTQSLLQAAISSGTHGFVFLSSILAAQVDDVENSTKRATAYAASKKKAEELVLAAQADNFNVTILRPVNVYGPGMKGNIAGLIRRIMAGKLPPLPRLRNKLSLVSVSDLGKAAMLSAQNPHIAANQTYIVTDDRQYTPNMLESSIYAALGRKKPGWHSPRMVFYAASLGAQLLNNLGIWNNDLGLRTYRNLVENNEASCEKITTELGYKPSRTFAEELPAILSALD